MSSTKTSTLKMVLNLSGEGSKTHTLSLADPKDGLTRAEVDACAAKIIDDDLLDVNGRTVKSVKSAYIHTVEDTELE